MQIGRIRLAAVAVAIATAITVSACGSSSSTKTVTVITNASGGSTTLGSTTSSITPAPAMSAAAIKNLQAGLRATGCYDGTIDGVAGPSTTQALRAFQSASGLAVDGVVGPNTNAKLQAAVSSGTKVCASAPAPAPTATAPCTNRALMAALGAQSGDTIARFGCAGGYAYAFVLKLSGPNGEPGIEYTQLFAAHNGAWVTADRSSQCSLVPKAIYAPACLTN
jgi:peptidoglycan hydrolase-like protein with peptidoglycan-binding domain